MFVVKKKNLYMTSSGEWVPLSQTNRVLVYPAWLPAAQDAHRLGAEAIGLDKIVMDLVSKIETLTEGEWGSITEHAYESEESKDTNRKH